MHHVKMQPTDSTTDNGLKFSPKRLKYPISARQFRPHLQYQHDLLEWLIRAPSHVDDDISVPLIVKYILLSFLTSTCSSGKRVYCSSGKKSNTTTNERLSSIHTV
jgi:hypothetical protein